MCLCQLGDLMHRNVFKFHFCYRVFSQYIWEKAVHLKHYCYFLLLTTAAATKITVTTTKSTAKSTTTTMTNTVIFTRDRAVTKISSELWTPNQTLVHTAHM